MERCSVQRWVFGVHPVLEVLRTRPVEAREVLLARRAGGRSEEIERLSRAAGVRIRHVKRHEIDAVVGDGVHQGVAVSVEPARKSGQEKLAPADPLDLARRLTESGKTPLFMALDRIQDPRNLGAILRSAYVLGAHGVIAPRDRASGLTPAVVKASAGTADWVSFFRVTNLARTLDTLKDAGLWVVGADVDSGGDAKALDRSDLTGPLVLVVGAEGPGLRRLVRERCDFLVEIPMKGRSSSLNASVAAGILLYEVLRQRRGAVMSDEG